MNEGFDLRPAHLTIWSQRLAKRPPDSIETGTSFLTPNKNAIRTGWRLYTINNPIPLTPRAVSRASLPANPHPVERPVNEDERNHEEHARQ